LNVRAAQIPAGRVASRQPTLPIDDLLPAILASLQQNPSLVIEAPPGAGKTTRVPAALLQAVAGNVLVLEPRRIAARLAARRVAWELGEELGATVGYQVRFERVAGPSTRLHFVTEGVLTRRLFSDPTLKGVDAVILDEFHERHLDTDLALALLKRLRRQRPELRLVVMSATLDAAPVAEFLDNCPIVRSEGRQFELDIRHLPYSPDPLHQQVADAFAKLLNEQGDERYQGNTLVFLPGAAEIRRAQRACEPLARAHGILVLPLHGDLSPAEQDRVVAPSAERKLILSTNVAESSVTIDGVTAVIDSGLARIASHSPWTGLPTLQIGRVSKASARQRAGRAGRTGPGRVLRLYSEADYQQRADHDTPEILRSDLAQLCLSLRAMGISNLAWLDAPPPVALENAGRLLDRLGATGASAAAKNEMARKLVAFPLPPRLSRMIVAAVERGVGEAGCVAAALLSSGVRLDANDLLAAVDAHLDGLPGAPRDERFLKQLRQLRRLSRPTQARPPHPAHSHNTLDDEALLQAILTGFPDRVARLRSGSQVLLSTGSSAEIAGQPPVHPFFVALGVEDRAENPQPLIRLFARIEPEWLIDLFPDRVREETIPTWNRTAERVDAISRLVYDELVLQESTNTAPDPEAAAALLAEKALESGVERFVDPEALEQWLGRVEFAGFSAPPLPDALRDLCQGLRSFADLKAAARDFTSILEARLPQGRFKGQRFQELAPLTLRLHGGRTTKVHYERGKTPWIASRLQDFFGMTETPRIGPERTPVVLHLLAPNQRAVQTTTDLAGFWQRLYPQVRRELMRRYPRHQWPENPCCAQGGR
jgi:ATP-dependent helicase HrpB